MSDHGNDILTPADVAQMVADACHECLSLVDQVINVDWRDTGEVILTLRADGSVYDARAVFTIGQPRPAND